MSDRNQIPLPPRVTGELWMGGYPHPEDYDYFDLIISAVSEGETLDTLGKSVTVIHVPLHDRDDELENPATAANVRKVANDVMWMALQGQKVLVHCGAGLNRSGVITARALMHLGLTADDAVRLIRQHRNPSALFNRGFERWLSREDGFDDTPLTSEEVSEQR